MQNYERSGGRCKFGQVWARGCFPSRGESPIPLHLRFLTRFPSNPSHRWLYVVPAMMWSETAVLEQSHTTLLESNWTNCYLSPLWGVYSEKTQVTRAPNKPVIKDSQGSVWTQELMEQNFANSWNKNRFLNAEKNILIIRTVERWHSFLVRTEKSFCYL